jgi:hypothetical protein
MGLNDQQTTYNVIAIYSNEIITLNFSHIVEEIPL